MIYLTIIQYGFFVLGLFTVILSFIAFHKTDICPFRGKYHNYCSNVDSWHNFLVYSLLVTGVVLWLAGFTVFKLKTSIEEVLLLINTYHATV